MFPVTLTKSGLPILLEGEVVYVSKNATLSSFGRLTVTSHRLFFVRSNLQAVAINLADVRSAELEPVRYFSRAVRPLILILSGRGCVHNELLLTFESQLDTSESLSALSRALERQSWVAPMNSVVTKSVRPVGISGILKHHERNKQTTGKLANASFIDLESLMLHANKVVVAMERCQVQAEAEAHGTENARLHDILSQFGIRSPVTKSVAGLDFHLGLARELGDFLHSRRHLERTGGMMTLPDLFCLWNRARGMALVSPDDLLLSAQLLAQLEHGMTLRSFDTGVVVVQGKSHQDDLIGAQLKEIAVKHVFLTPTQVSALLKIPVALSREHIRTAEKNGFLCRDDASGVLSYYPNHFLRF